MTIAGQNFEVFQGDNKEIIVTVYDEDGIPLEDLTGYEAVWCVHTLTPHTNVVEKSTAGGGILLNVPASGQFTIILDSLDTEALIPKTYGHQAEIEDAGGNHSTILTGSVKILKSITHSEL